MNQVSGSAGEVAPHSQSFVRESVAFDADGTTLRGWVYRPLTLDEDDAPLIVMAHGYGSLKEGLTPLAETFAAHGFACLVYDHPNLGESDGSPRQQIDPWAQVRGYRHAITCASDLAGIDPQRIGIWGTSFAGAHVLVVAAVDARVRAVVSQVPLTHPWERFERGLHGDLATLFEELSADRLGRANGKPPRRIKLVTDSESEAAVFHVAESDLPPVALPRPEAWINETTLASVDMLLEYAPISFAKRISPTPLLMIVTDNDRTAPTDLALEFYDQAREPKRLVILPGAHHDVYGPQFGPSTDATLEWFREHLSRPAEPIDCKIGSEGHNER